MAAYLLTPSYQTPVSCTVEHVAISTIYKDVYTVLSGVLIYGFTPASY